jgi:hypothetical protein
MKFLTTIILIILLTLGVASQSVSAVHAQGGRAPLTRVATSSAVASESAQMSTPSASVIPAITEKEDNDITDTSGQQKNKLTTFLEQNPAQPLSWSNPVELAVRYAIEGGIPANVLVLVLLFPLVASLIAASRHIIGLRGFGIYIPAVLSVAFASTGMIEGLIIFTAIITAALFSKRIIRKLRLSYLPRTALLLWMISLGIFIVLLAAPWFHLVNLVSVDIFPVLILVLLAENFLSAQSSTKESDAFALTLETVVLALAGAFFLNWQFMQRVALLDPELLIIATVALNIIVGKFVGLRVTEWLRFRPIIEEEE